MRGLAAVVVLSTLLAACSRSPTAEVSPDPTPSASVLLPPTPSPELFCRDGILAATETIGLHAVGTPKNLPADQRRAAYEVRGRIVDTASLPRATIEAKLCAATFPIRECVRAIGGTALLHGAVVVTLDVVSGEVKRLQLDEGNLSDPARKCIRDTLTAIRFAGGTGSTRYSVRVDAHWESIATSD